MGVKVTPSLTIGGYEIACSADKADTEPVAVRSVKIDWGRNEYHDASATPATMTLHLADVTDEWADYIRRNKAVGREVRLQIEGRPVLALDGTRISGTTHRMVVFRGRVSRATAKLTKSESGQGARRWIITLVCADSTAAMGGVHPGPSEWPTEAMMDRALRIRGLSEVGTTRIENFYFRSEYHMFGVSPLDVKGKSALQLLGDFYGSMAAETWSYDPDGNVVRQVPRLSQDMTVRLQSSDEQHGAVKPAVDGVHFEGVTYPGIGLGGCQLTGDPVIEADPATVINRVEVNWKNREREWDDTISVHENVYPGDARRVLSWDTWLGDQENVEPAQNALWARVNEEGRRPRHPEFTTQPTHVFPNWDVTRWVLMAWENPRPCFISSDAAHQWLMGTNQAYGPIVAPIGGTLHFDPKDGWSALLRTHFIHNTRSRISPVPWQGLKQYRRNNQRTVPWMWERSGTPPGAQIIDQSTIKNNYSMPNRYPRWGKAPSNRGYCFHTSVTWSDLRYIDNSGAEIKDVAI
ncbi:hypothetical protein [Corynebacterium mastitidis]|uniref:hypothetical protein n=1 Tax=Corynebacterium mastitidis TaxID=161890 RepID=UPI00254AC809|nr:hypothetical protein [Corynebacterium mastitidis]MDK8450888.1 hypothetical protein [Corynebacterium mastitidis]